MSARTVEDGERLIPYDLSKHPLSLSLSPEELDHLLDLGANDSPDNHAPKTRGGGHGLRLLAESCVPIKGSLRWRTARIVFDQWLGRRPLVDDDEPVVASDDPLKRLLFVARIDGEAIVL